MTNTRIDLDERMLTEINKYYNSRLEEEHLHKECFSHPDLDSHFCCAKSPMHGGRLCDYCGHRPDRICRITCNIHQWCLATCATRFGIGSGKNLYARIKDNLGLKYDDLLEQVRNAIKDKPNNETEEVPNVVTTPVYEVKELEEIVGELPTEILEEENLTKEITEMHDDETTMDLPNDLISIKEAAECWPCTLPNVYSKVKSGKLVAYDVDGNKKVSKAAVEALKGAKRGGGRKKKNA